ncbi:hypothetical protein [Chryseolinea sp. H1M3-3]|uniref:hypothetical protein n=1 Tax=Chryseolinea sp. H1M3-3 TaxID=3034144 RepID=UPI0023EC8784|nr:hypothetical protein [Chryseolinea sp. H1M3-3]
MKILPMLFGPLLICFSISCYAQSYSLEVDRFKTTDNFIVSINNPVAVKLTVHIKDKDGKAVFQESFMFVEKIKKVLFLGSLPPGPYIVEVFNGVETKTANIKIDGLDKMVHPENGKGLVVGFSKLKADNSIDVIVQNKLDKNVSLKVYKENALLSSEDLGQGGEIVKKVLKLNKAEKGDFIVRVGTKENLYQYKITL